MQQQERWVQVFTPGMIDTLASIWTRSTVALLDVRHKDMDRQHPLQDYRLPGNTFVYVYGGAAHVQLDNVSFGTERFGIVHGGKGTMLSISPEDGKVGVFMALYRVDKPLFFQKELQRLLEQANPFVQRFAYMPGNPVRMVELFQRMLDGWKQGTGTHQLYVKGLLYQMIHEIYSDLKGGDIRFLQPAPALYARRYLDEHYREPITFREIADLFGISGGQLTRLFKRSEGMNLQQYLTGKRLEAASRFLTDTEMTIKEIAQGCGFIDDNNLLRMFKKRYKVSPSEYRKKNTLSMQVYGVDNDSQRLYNEKGSASPVKSQRDGELTMFGQFGQARSKEMIVAAAMSLMLLLSACASATPASNGGTASQTPAPTQQTEATPGAEQNGKDAVKQTRTIRTTKGDVEVPLNPQRVVVQYLMGDVVALGVAPIGISDVYDGAAFSELVTDAVDLGWMPEWESESIMKLDPDLILVAGEDDVEKYSKIAPTVFIPYGDMTQDERLTFIGEVLNRQEAVAEAIDLYNTTLEQAKASLAEAGFDNYTVSVFEGGSDATMGVFGNKFGAGSVVYASLGLHAPEAVKTNVLEKDSYSELVSFEVLSEYTGDFVVRNTYEGMADLSEDPIWNSLAAVQNNRVIEMKFGLNYYSDIYSAIAQINYVTEALLRASSL